MKGSIAVEEVPPLRLGNETVAVDNVPVVIQTTKDSKGANGIENGTKSNKKFVENGHSNGVRQEGGKSAITDDEKSFQENEKISKPSDINDNELTHQDKKDSGLTGSRDAQLSRQNATTSELVKEEVRGAAQGDMDIVIDDDDDDDDDALVFLQRLGINYGLSARSKDKNSLPSSKLTSRHGSATSILSRQKTTRSLVEAARRVTIGEDGQLYRLLSAKRNHINQLSSDVTFLHKRIKELEEQNRLLVRVGKRQEAALARYENMKSQLPLIIEAHQIEIGILKEKLRRSVTSANRAKEKQASTDERFLRQQDELVRLKDLARRRNLPAREELHRQLTSTTEKLTTAEKKIGDLQKRLDLLNKSLKQQVSAEVSRNRSLSSKHLQLQQEHQQLQEVLKEKTREVARLQVYSRRSSSTPHGRTPSEPRSRSMRRSRRSDSAFTTPTTTTPTATAILSSSSSSGVVSAADSRANSHASIPRENSSGRLPPISANSGRRPRREATQGEGQHHQEGEIEGEAKQQDQVPPPQREIGLEVEHLQEQQQRVELAFRRARRARTERDGVGASSSRRHARRRRGNDPDDAPQQENSSDDDDAVDTKGVVATRATPRAQVRHSTSSSYPSSDTTSDAARRLSPPEDDLPDEGGALLKEVRKLSAEGEGDGEGTSRGRRTSISLHQGHLDRMRREELEVSLLRQLSSTSGSRRPSASSQSGAAGSSRPNSGRCVDDGNGDGFTPARLSSSSSGSRNASSPDDKVSLIEQYPPRQHRRLENKAELMAELFEDWGRSDVTGELAVNGAAGTVSDPGDGASPPLPQLRHREGSLDAVRAASQMSNYTLPPSALYRRPVPHALPPEKQLRATSSLSRIESATLRHDDDAPRRSAITP
ncbi:uncharacterized protein LOC143034400 [Oratosquilla oratoria]|uniref:uncharacterized protein LOC143034400 n=1 Tax=Oratosquilla oratoria TaxID=337810 RepID=UPI003F76289E